MRIKGGGASGGGDADCSGQPQCGGDGVADRGQYGWGVAGPGARGVLAVGHIAHPVHAVLDRPVTSHERGELVRVGLVGARLVMPYTTSLRVRWPSSPPV